MAANGCVVNSRGSGPSSRRCPARCAYPTNWAEGVLVHDPSVPLLSHQLLGADPEVDTYYRDIVRHGPGAFVEFADGYAGFRNAMTRKLFRETNDLVIGTPSGRPPEAPADGALTLSQRAWNLQVGPTLLRGASRRASKIHEDSILF